MQRSLSLLGHVSSEHLEQSKESEYGGRRKNFQKPHLKLYLAEEQAQYPRETKIKMIFIEGWSVCSR